MAGGKERREMTGMELHMMDRQADVVGVVEVEVGEEIGIERLEEAAFEVQKRHPALRCKVEGDTLVTLDPDRTKLDVEVVEEEVVEVLRGFGPEGVRLEDGYACQVRWVKSEGGQSCLLRLNHNVSDATFVMALLEEFVGVLNGDLGDGGVRGLETAFMRAYAEPNCLESCIILPLAESLLLPSEIGQGPERVRLPEVSEERDKNRILPMLFREGSGEALVGACRREGVTFGSFFQALTHRTFATFHAAQQTPMLSVPITLRPRIAPKLDPLDDGNSATCLTLPQAACDAALKAESVWDAARIMRNATQSTIDSTLQISAKIVAKRRFAEIADEAIRGKTLPGGCTGAHTCSTIAPCATKPARASDKVKIKGGFFAVSWCNLPFTLALNATTIAGRVSVSPAASTALVSDAMLQAFCKRVQEEVQAAIDSYGAGGGSSGEGEGGE